MTKKIIIGAILVLIILAIVGSASNTKPVTEHAQRTPSLKIFTSPTPSSEIDDDIQNDIRISNEQPTTPATPKYKIAHRDANNLVENYEILITPGADGEVAALNIKQQCKQPCNIYVYDDVRAQQLDREYADIADGDSATAWKQQNYVYVADHLVGNIDFETSEWDAYPYRDFYYRQLGGNN